MGILFRNWVYMLTLGILILARFSLKCVISYCASMFKSTNAIEVVPLGMIRSLVIYSSFFSSFCICFRKTKWTFLEGVQKSGAAPTRAALVNQCRSDATMLDTLCEAVSFSCVDFREQLSNPVHRANLCLWLGVACLFRGHS